MHHLFTIYALGSVAGGWQMARAAGVAARHLEQVRAIRISIGVNP
ncbi:MAG: hypothetical protein Ct9H300mP14_16740 [Gammaproteobacteria bacterium]|nr:MAG: hypothetical protein Ct9H300mP14_16740 [Gammaproteobacteria bacterium]